MLIRKVGVLSLAINSAVIGAIAGLVIALVFLLFGSAFMTMMQTTHSAGLEGSAFGAGMGVIGLVLFPIMYAVFGFIGGAIYALIFNLAARITGGLQIETA